MMNTTIKELPKSFVIKRDANNPLWDKYIYWLNTTYNQLFKGCSATYYGFDKYCTFDENLSYFSKDTVVLTLEEWDNIVNKKDEFKLPKNWCVKVNEQNKDLLNHYRINIKKYSKFSLPSGYLYITCSGAGNDEVYGYTEITFEQFKKYVLKQNDMNKEIIGYKLVKPEYKEAAFKLASEACLEREIENLKVSIHSLTIPKLKEAGVLDLWFEPVYKEEKTLPKFSSYIGKYENGILTYGCQSFSSEFIKTIANANSIDSITIKGVLVTKEQIKEIYECIKSKD